MWRKKRNSYNTDAQQKSKSNCLNKLHHKYTSYIESLNHQKRCKNIRLEIKKISFVLLFREVEMFLNDLHIHSYFDNRYYYERIKRDAAKRENSIKTKTKPKIVRNINSILPNNNNNKHHFCVNTFFYSHM